MINGFVKGLESLRKKRQGKIAYLELTSEGFLDDMLFSTIRRTKKDYSKAVIDYVRDNHKDVSVAITEISSHVSRIYKECKEGKATLDDFKEILQSYHNICTKAIELYKSKIENEQTKEFGLLRK